MTKPFSATAMAFIVGLAVLASAPLAAGAPQQVRHDHEAQSQQTEPSTMKMGPMKMTHGTMDDMAARKKANTERITALMARIQSAAGDEKVAAMAEVIAILVDERAAMQEHCAEMGSSMDK